MSPSDRFAGSSDRSFEVVAHEVVALCERLTGDGGEWVEIHAQHRLCVCLERFVPWELAAVHPEWQGESLDGFMRSDVRLLTDDTLEFRGVSWRLPPCALLPGDEFLPVLGEFRVTEEGTSLAEYRFRVGFVDDRVGARRGRSPRRTRRRSRRRDHTFNSPPTPLQAERLLAAMEEAEWAYGVEWRAGA